MTEEQHVEYLRVACLGALAALAHPSRASADIAMARSLLAAALLMTTGVAPTADHAAVIRSILTDDERRSVA